MKNIIINGIISAFSIIKVILPVLIFVEILKYYDLIKNITVLVTPLLSLLNLPSEFGIVWVVSLFTGVYGGVASFLSIIDNVENYSVAEVTTLSSLILIAHALPIESKISKLLGVSYWKSMVFRFVSSIFFSFFVNIFLTGFHLLQQNVNLAMPNIAIEESHLINIIINPLTTSFKIGVIIILLYFFIEILKKINVISILERALKPLTYLLNIDERLSSSLVIGVLLGISYGGALLQNDFKDLKDVKDSDKKSTVYFINLLHSLIEDTMLVLLIGANFFIVFFGRIIFSVVVLLCLNSYSSSKVQKQS